MGGVQYLVIFHRFLDFEFFYKCLTFLGVLWELGTPIDIPRLWSGGKNCIELVLIGVCGV